MALSNLLTLQKLVVTGFAGAVAFVRSKSVARTLTAADDSPGGLPDHVLSLLPSTSKISWPVAEQSHESLRCLPWLERRHTLGHVEMP